ESGRFSATLSLPQPKDYVITAQAKSAKGYLSQVSQPVIVRYNPIPPFRTVRRVTAYVSYRNVSVDLLAILPRTDPTATQFISGTIPFSQFLDNTFSGYRPTNRPLSDWFKGITPTIYISS